MVIPITTTRFEMPLGVWTFSECRPTTLSGAVESIWEVEGIVVNPRERIFPGPYIEIIVNLGRPQRIIGDAEACGAFGDGAACASGLQQRPLIVEAEMETHVFGMRLHAAAAHALVGTDMNALSGRVVRLRDVVRDSRAIVERFRAAASFEDRAAVACWWMEARLARKPRRDSYVDWLAANIERTGGRAAIDTLRRDAGVSKVRLAADFRAHIGATPKRFARLVRFGRVRAMLTERPGSLARVAAAAGYYDQAHMTSEFREFAGLTPTEFLVHTYPDGNSAVETFFQDIPTERP